MTELEAALQVLEQIKAAAHFDATNEDYNLVDRVYDLYVNNQKFVQLLTAHPELKKELEP